ncbi:MAG: hybrid sensor histidine kinase/response regulator [Hyphomonadaceae bacterium]|nr:hybrid sensor histidine kinase/response regulator [Hyphomonadaceae bacterium]
MTVVPSPHASADGTPPPRSPRADALSISVIIIVALLVAALAFAFSAHSSLQARTLDTIALSRGVRDDALHISQALADLEAARHAQPTSRVRVDPEAAAAAEMAARAHTSVLQRRCAAYPALAADAARVAALVEQVLAADPSSRETLVRAETARSEIWAAMDDLLRNVGALNDTARELAEQRRAQLDMIAIVLGILSLMAAGLAVVSIRRERTTWRLAHAAAEDARAKAAASDIAKTRFLAVASHDMRQPLHALTLYLTALERRVETEEARDIVAKMDRAVQSMIGMFASLLDLARLQAGVITPNIIDAPLQPIFEGIAAEHPGDKVIIAATDLTVRSDQRLLERVISNLVGNAVKHGGSARLEARAKGGMVEIAVADNGPGIAAEDHERIFNEFERLGASSDGLGLGLTIVRRLSALIGAQVKLVSTPGQGARFTVSAPLAQRPEQPVSQRARCDALTGAPVLAMDDDALAREAMAGLLRDLGADVRACASGEEAESIVRQGFVPRLLLLDLRINGDLRGLDVAARLRALIEPAPSIVIITGDTEPQTLDALRASGHAWLIKPIDAEELAAVAAAQLNNATAT